MLFGKFDVEGLVIIVVIIGVVVKLVFNVLLLPVVPLLDSVLGENPLPVGLVSGVVVVILLI